MEKPKKNKAQVKQAMEMAKERKSGKKFSSEAVKMAQAMC